MAFRDPLLPPPWQGGPAGLQADEARQLTDEGRAALRAAAPYWKALGVKPDVVLTSPRQRAIDTATLFIAGVGLAGAAVADEHLAPGAKWPEIARAIAPHVTAGSVMLVGHEPDLSRSVKHLTGSAVRLREGSVCRLEFRGPPEPGTGEITLSSIPTCTSPALTIGHTGREGIVDKRT